MCSLALSVRQGLGIRVLVSDNMHGQTDDSLVRVMYIIWKIFSRQMRAQHNEKKSEFAVKRVGTLLFADS